MQRRIVQLEERVDVLESENRDLRARERNTSSTAEIVDALWSLLSEEEE